MAKLVDIWDSYEDWLLDRVGFDRNGYNLLMNELHNSPFEWLIERDKSRETDGLFLRDEFFSDSHMRGEFHKDCGVLEMLISLAIRFDNEYGDPGDERPDIIFWEMIENLGLDRFTDKRFNKKGIYKILGRWLKREFEYNGDGSIFPLKNPSRDQRDCEIWSQMNEYVRENY